MEFIRVDKRTVKCVLTEEDLSAHGVQLSDFFENSDSARELIDYLLDKMINELNYKKNGDMISINIVALPENSIALTFSDATEDFKQVFRQLAALANRINSENDIGKDDMTKSALKLDKDVKRLLAKYGNTIQDKRKPDYDYLVFEADSIEKARDYAGSINIRKEYLVALSNLYRREDGGYYFVLCRGAMHPARFRYLAILALEFFKFKTTNPEFENWLNEHCKAVVLDNAIEVLSLIEN